MPESEEQEPPAAAATEVQPGAAGRRHLYRALTRPTRSQLVVAVLLGALGLAAVTQVRANDVSNAYAGYREQDLIDILNGLSTLSERTERQIESLETTRDELRSTRTSRQAALQQAQENATNLSILAGLVPVTGPGVRVTIGTGVEQLSIDVLLDTIQELRTAGAEAIEFNDELRIVAQSAFEVSGSGILVDGVLVPAPYLIDAIGDPETLAGAITFSRGPQEVIESRGGTVVIDERSVIEIESIATPVAPEFSAPE
jgi:uncharacterized protein YlxW (UPF0749 family)